MNRVLVKSVRAILADSKLPKRFRTETLATATYLLTGNKPNVENLRIFGCKAFAHVPKYERTKLDSNCFDGIKGYRDKKRVFFSRDVKFDEISGEFEEKKSGESEEPSFEINLQPHEGIVDKEEQEEKERQGRERHPPDCFGEWVYITQDEDPITFRKAVSGQDGEK